MRGFILVATLILGCAASVSSQVNDTEILPKAIGPYSHSIAAGGLIFTSGQIGTDPKTGELVGTSTAEQTAQALKNVEAVLKGGGSGLDQVVKVTVFLADMNDFAKMNEVYARFFKRPFPARSTVQVARLPRDAKVEIDAIAVRKNGKQ